MLGMHRGLWFHTIGQRKGLGFGGGPWYVVKKDMERNILWVANGYDTMEAYESHFFIAAPHWLTVDPFCSSRRKPFGKTEGHTHIGGHSYVGGLNMTIKIRHTPEYYPATLEWTSSDSFIIHSKEKIHGVAPGQFCVIYDQNHHRCLGSAEITI